MIRDLKECKQGVLSGYDVCVVGTGPAGTTVANELHGSGLKICVLESGGERPTPRGNELRRVVWEGVRIKEHSRERVLGGTSTTWSGGSSPLDAIDIEPRPHVPFSGWPITRDELAGYWAQAADRYRFAPLSYFEADGFGATKSNSPLQPRWSALEEKYFLAGMPPQDFGREWRTTFEGDDIDLWFDATLVRLEVGDDASRVAHGVVRTSSARELIVRARTFVLATGGIENARLLLCSDDGAGRALGNEHDQVGRYLMNHPKHNYGVVRLKKPVDDAPYYFGGPYRGFAGRAAIRIPPSGQLQHGLLNAFVLLHPLPPWADDPGVHALTTLVDRFRIRRRSSAEPSGADVGIVDDSEEDEGTDAGMDATSARTVTLVGRILLHLPRVLQFLYFRLTRGTPSTRLLRVRNYMEMEPQPENRVFLSDELDANGQPVPVVRHNTSALARGSLVAVHTELGRDLERDGVGRLDQSLEDAVSWPVEWDASHHMGTTRMGADPQTSVVDPECRVHSIENLFVAGSSVFPTGGACCPTFTIVALSIRLARHLRRTTLGDEHAAGEGGDVHSI